MPTRASLPCRHHGCPALLPQSGYCVAHQRQVYKAQDQRRGSAASRGYNSKWAKARKTYLGRNPLCVECIDELRVTPATEVDHIIPHRGSQTLFWDTDNWQALCKPHHSAKTMRESVPR